MPALCIYYVYLVGSVVRHQLHPYVPILSASKGHSHGASVLSVPADIVQKNNHYDGCFPLGEECIVTLSVFRRSRWKRCVDFDQKGVLNERLRMGITGHWHWHCIWSGHWRIAPVFVERVSQHVIDCNPTLQWQGIRHQVGSVSQLGGREEEQWANIDVWRSVDSKWYVKGVKGIAYHTTGRLASAAYTPRS